MAETSIDDLPEVLLLHILSFLPTINAVKASLISRRWRNLWRHIPTLNFDLNLYHSSLKHRNDLYDSREAFTEFITQTLLQRDHSILLDSFRLLFSYRDLPRTKIQVGSWIRHAIASEVLGLRLSFDEDLFEADYRTDCDEPELCGKYDFHFSDLKNSCWVRVLELIHCRMIWPKSVPTDGFPSLSSVSLHDVSVRDNVLFALVSSCVNLEFLSLSNLCGLRHFKIHSKTLKELDLGFFKIRRKRTDAGSLEIYAPSLVTITFDCFSVAEYCFRDASSLVEAHVERPDESEDDFDCCRDILPLLTGVERLTMQNMRSCFNRYVWDQVREDVSKCSEFNNLKYLELKIGYTEYDLFGLAAFLEVCPELELLVLDNVKQSEESWYENFKGEPLIFPIPSLKQVRMKNYRRTLKELCLVELLKMHKVVLQKIVAFPPIVDGKLLPPVVLLDSVL